MPATRHVAILIETSREYGRGLLRGVTRYHREQAQWSIYFKPQGLGEPPPDWLANWRGDGILARIDDRRMASGVLRTGLPVVDLRGALGDIGVPSIGVDNREVARLALEHLLDRGWRHVAFCGVPRGRNRFDDERCDLFQEQVKAAGYPCHTFNRWRKWGNWEQGQQQLADWLTELPKPVGVMACHDDRGQQVLDACQRASVNVPDEVAVIGVDDDPYLCNLTIPSMTSVNVNAQRNGYEAAQLLDRMMSGRRPPSQPIFLVPVGVTARQSTDTITVDDPDVARVVRFIRDHAAEPISIEQALSQVAVSRSTVTRSFKRLLGRTPKAYLTHVRLEHARQLLMDTALTIEEVARRSGFQEAKYFIEVFHRKSGITPGSFRRR